MTGKDARKSIEKNWIFALRQRIKSKDQISTAIGKTESKREEEDEREIIKSWTQY